MIKKRILQLLRYACVAVSITGLCILSAANAAELKNSAPERYVVKKGDTLWDISGMYLDEPWRWPELWVKNTQIENPHLIYPGDVIILSFVDGEPVLIIERTKQRFVLTPQEKRIDKSNAIDVLPWEILQPYVESSWVVEESDFEQLPKVLGNSEASVTFSNDDLLLTRRAERTQDQYYIGRNMGSIQDMQGNALGYQLNHVANAQLIIDELDSNWLVRVADNNQEVVVGDVLWDAPAFDMQDLQLTPAQNVRGNIVGGFYDHAMFGKLDVVIVDLGKTEVSPGTVLGIYSQGPSILDGDAPRYVKDADATPNAFNNNALVIQPALKLGELVVFSVFDKASFGIITRSEKQVRHGYIVGEP
jgi:hypothetical protein